MGAGASFYLAQIEQIQEKVTGFPDGEDVTTLEEARKQLVMTRNMVVNLYKIYQKTSNLSQDLINFTETKGKVPDAWWLQHSESCKECFGPLSIDKHVNNQSKIKVKNKLDLHGNDPDKIDVTSKAKLDKKKLYVRQKNLGSKIQRSLVNLSRTMEAVASECSHRLLADVQRYTTIMDKMVSSEPEAYAELNATAGEIVNVSELQVGAEVFVVHANARTKAKVVAIDSGSFKISIWKELAYANAKYSEGYDTREPEYRFCKRSELYAMKGEKVKQSISQATISNICDNDIATATLIRDVTMPGFLMALYIEV